MKHVVKSAIAASGDKVKHKAGGAKWQPRKPPTKRGVELSRGDIGTLRAAGILPEWMKTLEAERNEA